MFNNGKLHAAGMSGEACCDGMRLEEAQPQHHNTLCLILGVGALVGGASGGLAERPSLQLSQQQDP
jgi:hypothetical protein